ncbi:MAG: carbohydrate binding family 9 domain-containing protein, partial [Planctomycetota bacterium]
MSCLRRTALGAAILGVSLQAQRPEHAPERLAAGTEITVDAVLSEPIWASAVPITEFTQVVPIEGGAPSVATRLRVVYDEDALYLGLECLDDPANVRARLNQRDARLDPDDRVEFWFDTFDDQRFGYWFQIGAAGSLGDALLADGGDSFNKSWDGIWNAAARQTATGWVAEIELPFKTLAFRPGHSRWGFNVRRFRKANDEELRFA